MGRAPCCEKVGLKKGRWTNEEDELLIKYIQANGEGSWRSLPKNAGLLRCGKSCRLRWLNYLRADVKRGNITPQEEELIIRLHTSLGNRWSLIAGHLPGRTDNEIKNYWNSRLSRKIQSFTRPGNESHPTNFMNMPKFTPGTCKRRRGRISRSAMMKKNKHRMNLMAPKATTSVGQVEPSKQHMDEFDEILGQFDEHEQSVVSWPSEESSSAIKLCPNNNKGPYEGLGGGESEIIMCLDDILGSGAVDPSGVFCHNDERENGGSGITTMEERENCGIGPDQGVTTTTTTSTSEGRSREQQSGVWSSKTESGEMYTGSSAMSNDNWVDWNMESDNVHDQKLLDEEEMLSWLWDGGNGEGHHV